MKLREYQGKHLFEEYDIAIPKGYLVSDSKEVSNPKKGSFMIKAQLLTGGRGKAGAVVKAKAKEVKKQCKALLGKEIKGEVVKSVLVEEALPIKKEYYIAFTIDRNERNMTLLVSKKGGIDIEELADKHPKSIMRWNFFEYDEKAVKKKVKDKKLLEVIHKLHHVMKERDALLVEVNPLIVTKKNQYIAADSKVIIDNSSLFKHMEFEKLKYEGLTNIEKKAAEKGVNFVEMKGDIAVIGNGAGLVMNTLDILKKEELQAADFLDVGGGAEHDKVKTSMEIVAQTKPKAVFLNIFGGITDCMEVYTGISEFLDENRFSTPIIARIVGTNAARARKMLAKKEIPAYDNVEKSLRALHKVIHK